MVLAFYSSICKFMFFHPPGSNSGFFGQASHCLPHSSGSSKLISPPPHHHLLLREQRPCQSNSECCFCYFQKTMSYFALYEYTLLSKQRWNQYWPRNLILMLSACSLTKVLIIGVEGGGLCGHWGGGRFG